MDNQEMHAEKLNRLIKAYLNGTATESQRRELLSWYESETDKPVFWTMDHPDEKTWLKEAMREKVQRHASNKPSGTISRKFMLVRVAAVLLLAFGVLIGLRIWNSGESVQAPSGGGENRYITLADGSTVVLRSGSTLEFPENFKGETREVYLKGEAFFDIAHDPDKPFIIHTGKVRTVVLGTAFNIRAFPDQQKISVSVVRGKVRIENEREILATLTPDQHMVYEKQTHLAKKTRVNAQGRIDWTRNDMHFDAVSFSTLARQLERRYGVEIIFEHQALKACPITGRFTGRETITQVLDVLCATRGAHYDIKQDVIRISGRGCPELN